MTVGNDGLVFNLYNGGVEGVVDIYLSFQSSNVPSTGLGPAQDAPFALILWYVSKIYIIVGIGPIRDKDI